MTITWSGTWNTGSWTTADDCGWTCNTHYHRTGDSCVIDSFDFRVVENQHVNTQ